MKYYKLNNNHLHLLDDTTLLTMPLIGGGLTALSSGLQLLNSDFNNVDFIVVLWVLLFVASIVILILSYFKKSYARTLEISNIKTLKKSSVNSSVFYLQLHNGKQRNLTKIKSLNSANELLTLLKTAHGEIGVNFNDQQDD
jgi:hypothetical protein